MPDDSLSRLYAAVPAAAARDLAEREEQGLRQESLFPDGPDPDDVRLDEAPPEEPAPLTLRQAEALVRHQLGLPPAQG